MSSHQFASDPILKISVFFFFFFFFFCFLLFRLLWCGLVLRVQIRSQLWLPPQRLNIRHNNSRNPLGVTAMEAA